MTATATRCNPIIFSEPMVQAILDGRKTQTRRVIARANSTVLGYTARWAWGHLHHWERAWVDGPPDPIGGGDGYQYLHVPAWNPADGPISPDEKEWMWYRVRPRWELGDRLWVRETHWLAPSEAFAEGLGTHVIYRADRIGKCGRDGQPIIKWTWRPSIHMPRWASRITLEITGVRVQQVQDVSEPDAIAEGFERREHFARYWDVLNEKRGHGFDANPWVWVIAFDRESACGESP